MTSTDHPTTAGTATTIGDASAVLDADEIAGFVAGQLDSSGLEGASICLVVPDATRSCPLPLLISAIHRALRGRVRRCDVVVALGTHAPMDEEALGAHLGYPPGAPGERYAGLTVTNHAWWDPSTFVDVGVLSEDRVAELSEGRIRTAVPVRINRAVIDHDVTVIVGPVFPHEVVGFSGGNKYLFPGLSGPEVIDVSHWLGALLTSAAIIGRPGITPVRALLDDAAALVPGRRMALCVVTGTAPGSLCALSFGDPVAAWAAAAAVSARTHVRYLDSPVSRVLSLLPSRYDDLWTGAKGFYKVEPVVADGGEVVLYAPHITEISSTHPAIAEIGYHCRDYFLGQWDRFRRYRWSDLAHSTHLRGAGTYDAVNGERLRVGVTLATAIPEKLVRAVNLGYLDPTTVDPAAWAAEPGTLVVADAGEDLYRLADR